MAAYSNSFEATAMVSEWPTELWSIHLRGSLSGAALMDVSALSAVQQADFQIVKQTLFVCLPDFYRNPSQKGVQANIQC